MKIISSAKSKELDKYTITNEPISSINLMERAATCLTKAIMKRWDTRHRVVVFAGPGNNGGDALAVARMLSEYNYKVEVFLFNINENLSDDCKTNIERLKDCFNIEFTEVITKFDPPILNKEDLVIDGIFGTGLSKPLNGGFAAVVKYINASKSKVVSIDIPSGLMGEDNTYNNRQHIVKADVTLTIQLPKLSFFFPENYDIVGEVEVVDIGLSTEYLKSIETPFNLIEKGDIENLIKPRKSFANKGNFGHGLLIAGSKGMAGASILAAKSSLRSGIGLLTVHVPSSNLNIIQTSVPEAIVHTDSNEKFFSETEDSEKYSAIGIGPGIGHEEETAIAMMKQIKDCQQTVVLDADAINILAANKKWLSLLPKGCILTPHLKELERLVGTCHDSYDRLIKARDLANFIQGYIVAKGKWTTVITPEGNFYINPTGNPGMATAGTGDSLTGIILALLAQGYSHEDACKLGVYVHGVAGDIAAKEKGMIGMVTSDLIESLPYAWKELSQKK